MEFAKLLRYWRNLKGLSQLDLALLADISTKHISFLETGKSDPSRDMILLLCVALGIPLAERNILLNAAGFSGMYSRKNLDDPEMIPVKKALEFMMQQHEPYPAHVMDKNWNILISNKPQQKFIEKIKEKQHSFPTTQNVMELLFDPQAFRPFIQNWEEIAQIMLQRLKRQYVIEKNDEFNLYERLLQYPNIPKNGNTVEYSSTTPPMIYIDIKLDHHTLKLFSSLTSFGTATDITMQELIIEQYFPVDENTQIFFKSLFL